MLQIFNKKTKLSMVSAVVILGSAFSVSAELFNAYPGKYKSTLTNVEAANVVQLYIDVWAGYPRSLRVTLPGIAVPTDHPDAPACQQVLVQKALDFTKEFMADAKSIETRDLHMESSGDVDAQSHIYTDKGSLASKLTAEGLARPSSVDVLKPWCED